MAVLQWQSLVKGGTFGFVNKIDRIRTYARLLESACLQIAVLFYRVHASRFVSEHHIKWCYNVVDKFVPGSTEWAWCPPSSHPTRFSCASLAALSSFLRQTAWLCAHNRSVFVPHQQVPLVAHLTIQTSLSGKCMLQCTVTHVCAASSQYPQAQPQLNVRNLSPFMPVTKWKSV